MPGAIALFAIAVLIRGAAETGCAAPVSGGDPLALEFATPPDASKPWAYWWWVAANVDEATITRDLEAMKSQGIGGFLMFDARGYHEGYVPPPPSRMAFMGPEWRRMLGFAMREADRVGLKMSVNLSSCAGALRGPWDVGDDAPKQLVWGSADVQGPSVFRGPPPPIAESNAQEIATMAVRTDAGRAGEKTAREIVDLTKKATEGGDISWQVPEGRWTLLRFAWATMADHTNDVDILSAEAVGRYFNRMGRALVEDAGPLVGKTLTHLYSVSWEGAIPTWTRGFERQFESRRGYDLKPLLPALAGFTVESKERTARFLRDYNRTLADCFMENCYGTLRELCHAHGLKWHSESGGPWNRKLPTFEHADQFAFLAQNDMPQGEFWFRGRAMNRPSAMVSHVYGLPLAATEAFTHMRKHWSAYPAALKPDGDGAFCEGANFFIWHTFTCSPVEFGRPGIEYFAGTHLNPNVTWWPYAGDFLKYLARCQHMLRRGKFVADVCCYRGDRTYLHWGRWPGWVEKPARVPAQGRSYDLIDTRALLSRAAVRDGRIVLPDGMSYRALVLDLEEEEAPPEALRKAIALAEAGAIVIVGARRPSRAPGLKDFPSCDEDVRRLAQQIWGDGAPSDRPMGKGRIAVGHDIESVLKNDGPDFEGPFNFIHRESSGEDIYFLSGSGRADCSFRVGGKRPELWDAVTGDMKPAPHYRSSSDRTVVPIQLPENGSVFVVFRQPARATDLSGLTGPAAEDAEITHLGGDKLRVRSWKSGSMAVTRQDARGTKVEVPPQSPAIELNGPWDVTFEKGLGAPEKIALERLTAWNDSADPGIRHFSGTATYRIHFDLDAPRAARPARLLLGDVRNIARVRLNNNDLGVVWTAPWVLDLTGHVHEGKNDLEIDVANLWVNRLIGDASLPPEKRITKTNVPLFPQAEKLRPHCGFTANDPLEPSGLLGPILIEFGGDQVISF